MSRPAVLGARQPDLEALRALAALMVFASHLPWYQYFPNGLVRNAPAWLSPSAPIFGAGGFAVYLWHEPVTLLVRHLTGAPERIPLALLAAISAVCVGAVSILFTKVFSRWERSRARRSGEGEGSAR